MHGTFYSGVGVFPLEFCVSALKAASLPFQEIDIEVF